MNKKTIVSATDDIILELRALAKEKEYARRKLEITAKEKESIRNKLALTAKTLRLKAKQLTVTAKEKEEIRQKLELAAKHLAKTAKEKESTRSKLAIVAETLRLKAKQLAITAKEKEEIRQKLEITAKKLAVTAKEIESANKELRSLDLAKDEFVSIASHQLRTPLTALKGYTGMLLDGDAGPINDKQHEYLEEMKKANDRMIGLISSLLNVSRVDLGVFVVEPKPSNLEEIAKSVLSELEIGMKEKKLQLNIKVEKGIPLINADLKITRMIFQNLLTNALKYTPSEGSITLTIKKSILQFLSQSQILVVEFRKLYKQRFLLNYLEPIMHVLKTRAVPV